MVEKFINTTIKESDTIYEIAPLGPVLDREHYRKLLECFLDEFMESVVLNVEWLDELIQWVQRASSSYLRGENLIQIHRTTRERLQYPTQQSEQYSAHLTLAVSKVLNLMAGHRVQDLDRVVEHGHLFEVFWD
ncbi:hypothetical protein BGZ98_001842 [Dissophora globulifera]|nr:hypothetical protein BGZ98_001842 [Dissophora globulifera]